MTHHIYVATLNNGMSIRFYTDHLEQHATLSRLLDSYRTYYECDELQVESVKLDDTINTCAPGCNRPVRSWCQYLRSLVDGTLFRPRS